MTATVGGNAPTTQQKEDLAQAFDLVRVNGAGQTIGPDGQVVGGVVAIGMLGQSNERSAVPPEEVIGGVQSRIAYPQAFRSLRRPGLRNPVFPALAKAGGPIFRLHDELMDAGFLPHIVNGSIGGMSMVRDVCGQIQTRANSTAYRQKRAPIGHGDYGYAGDYTVVAGKVFLCTRGVLAFAVNSNNSNEPGGAHDIDYIRIVGTNATAASEPAGFATAGVGDVVVDGSVEWTCMSANTTFNGSTYTAGNVLTEVRSGFDPFALMHRLRDELGRVTNATHRVVMLQNAQSDLANANLSYQQALENIATFFLVRGCMVSVGLSMYQATADNTAAYNNLTTRVNGALNTLRTHPVNVGPYYELRDVITGANLYTLMGSTGAMAAGGAYFARDSGQDNIHLNAAGAIEAGRLMAQPIIAALRSYE